MIYEFPSTDLPIRQGDIFVSLPRVDISLRELPLLGADGEVRQANWREVADRNEPVTGIVGMRPVTAIVITQDCDSIRAPDITLCEIRSFRDVERKSAQTKAPKSWVGLLTQHARVNQKWFYLPPDQNIGFTEKMAVDFQVSLSVPREELEELRDFRRGRLNTVADEHFRERLSEFFRRYPYDEWYALDAEEFAVYKSEHPEAEPFEWQESLDTTEEQ